MRPFLVGTLAAKTRKTKNEIIGNTSMNTFAYLCVIIFLQAHPGPREPWALWCAEVHSRVQQCLVPWVVQPWCLYPAKVWGAYGGACFWVDWILPNYFLAECFVLQVGTKDQTKLRLSKEGFGALASMCAERNWVLYRCRPKLHMHEHIAWLVPKHAVYSIHYIVYVLATVRDTYDPCTDLGTNFNSNARWLPTPLTLCVSRNSLRIAAENPSIYWSNGPIQTLPAKVGAAGRTRISWDRCPEWQDEPMTGPRWSEVSQESSCATRGFWK